MSQKTVLIVGGGVLQCYAITAAAARGCRVVVTDADSTCPGASHPDVTVYWAISTDDIDGHRRLARSLHSTDGLHAVATCGADCSPTVAAVAEEAGLPGIPYPVAQFTHNKLLVRNLLASMLENVRWQTVRWTSAREDFLKALRMPVKAFGEHSGLVIKPSSQRASRGVTIVETAADLLRAIDRLAPYCQEGDLLLLEERHVGNEHSAEMIFNQDGNPCYFNLCDRWFRYTEGIPLEIGHMNPSSHVEDEWRNAFEVLCRAAELLGVRWGPFKADLLHTQTGEWKILEVTARLSGGFDSQVTVPLSTGRQPVQQVLALALGEEVPALDLQQPLKPAAGQYAACHAVFPPAGRLIASLTGEQLNDVYTVPGVQFAIALTRPGDVLRPFLEHGAQRAGFVIVTDESSLTAWHRAYQVAIDMARLYQVEEA